MNTNCEVIIEIPKTAIRSAVHPSEQISTARLHPSGQAISSGNLFPLGLSQNQTAPLVALFLKRNFGWDSNRVGASLLQSQFGRCLDGGR